MDEKFPEFTPKQSRKFINYLLINFDRHYHTINGCMEFLDGKISEISFGKVFFTRTNQDNVLVKTVIQMQRGSEKSNLLDIFSLN